MPRPETLGLARRFLPRYIAPGSSDFSDLAAVLKKMADGRKKAGRYPKEPIEVNEGWCETIENLELGGRMNKE